MRKLLKTSLILAIIFTLMFCGWGIVRIVKAEIFRMNCKEYILRASEASSIEIAKTELSKAISYAEKNNLTQGIVHIIIKDPANDVGFWYKNMKTAYEELDNIAEDASALEKTNVLMKLKESLTDTTEKNDIIATTPQGISIYPYNVLYLLWGFISFIAAIIFWIKYSIDRWLKYY